MEQLIKLINDTLKGVDTRIYQDYVDNGTEKPFAAFTLPNINLIHQREDLTLEIEVFGLGEHETGVYEIINNLRTLDGKRYENDFCSIRFKRQPSVFTIPEQDNDIIRKMIVFNVMTYYK